MNVLSDLFSLAKPRLSLLVLLTTGAGMFAAAGRLTAVQVVGGLGFTWLMVASANAWNCYLEHQEDALMHRTRLRPLPAGRLRRVTAWRASMVSAVVAFLGLLLTTNLMTAVLGLIAKTRKPPRA